MTKVRAVTLLLICNYAVLAQSSDSLTTWPKLIRYAKQCGGVDILKDGFMTSLNADRQQKCFISCVARKLGILTPDRKVNLKSARRVFETLGLNPEQEKSAKAAIQDCKYITDADECEVGHKLHICLEKSWNKYNPSV